MASIPEVCGDLEFTEEWPGQPRRVAPPRGDGAHYHGKRGRASHRKSTRETSSLRVPVLKSRRPYKEVRRRIAKGGRESTRNRSHTYVVEEHHARAYATGVRKRGFTDISWLRICSLKGKEFCTWYTNGEYSLPTVSVKISTKAVNKQRFNQDDLS